MLTPAQLEAMPYELQRQIEQLEDDILESMAERLVQADFDKEAFAWETQKAQELLHTREEIITILSRRSGVMERTIEEILKFAAVDSLSFDAAVYSLASMNPLPVVRSPGMQQLLKAGIANTKGVMRNWTRTTANTATKQFEDAMDRAYMQVLSGAFSPSTAVSHAVSDLAKSGIQSVRYPSGRVDHMDVAARRAVRTGVAQTTGTLQLQLAREIGCDLMQITSHLGARPSHAQWQGRVVSLSSKAGYLSQDAVGYGTGAGFKGWNCRHDWYPYVEGISIPAEIYDLDENRQVYEATQKQRALERQVRASKRACVADNAALDKCTDPETRAKLTQQLERDGALLKKREEAYKELTKDYRSQRGGRLTSNRTRLEAEGFDKALERKIKELSRLQVEKYGEIRYNDYGQVIATDDWKSKNHPKIPAVYKPNAVIETASQNGQQIDRTFYDEKGRMMKQVHSGAHGNRKQHPYGKNGEHVHVYIWDDNDAPVRSTRELDQTEQRENSDILLERENEN